MVAKSENMANSTVTGSGLDYVNGGAFTTKDRDQDEHENVNCSDAYNGGGWWFKRCYYVNLNGRVGTSGGLHYRQMVYSDITGEDWIVLSSSEMRMIRVG